MALELGTTDINKIYLGTNEIKKILLGSTVVYDKTAPPVSAIGDSIVYAMTATTSTVTLTEATAPLDTEVQNNSATYSTSSGVITVSTTGTYLIINHASVDRGTSGSNRTSAETFLHINGSLVTGSYTDGYIRRNSGSDECTSCAFGIYELTANDTIEMRSLRINGAGSSGRLVGNSTTYTDAKTSLTMVRLDENAATCILEGAVGDTSSLTASDSFDDQTWTTQTRLDSGYTHVSGSADIQLDAAGRYLVCYSNSWLRATDNSTRTGVYERLDLAGSDVGGSYANNYIRGSQNAESILRGNNSACTIIETTSANQILKLKSAREAGAITCDRLPLKSRICIYKLDSVTSFKVGSTSTENISPSTKTTVTYDSSEWLDSGYSLSTNQITCSNASKYLLLNTMEGDIPTSTRAEPYQKIAVSGFDNVYGTGSGYSRNGGAMYKSSPNLGIVSDVGASGTVEVNTISGSSAVNCTRVANSGGFCGIDLNTL
jgi:hypothetical protein